MNTKSIARTGMILSLMIISQLIKMLIPDLPNGLGDVFVLTEIIIIISSIAFSFYETISAVLIYILLIVWTNQTIFINGILWVNDIPTKVGVYFLDYFFPLIVLSLSGLITFKSKWKYFLIVSIIIFINYCFHVLAGIIFWGSYSWTGWTVVTYSIVANMIRNGSMLLFGTLIIYPTLMLQEHFTSFTNYGYLNSSKKINSKYQKESQRPELKNLKREAMIYEKLKIPYSLENNILQREWIEGKTIRFWTPKKLKSLKSEIEKFHNLDTSNIEKHDWTKYDHHQKHISSQLFETFTSLRNKYKNEKLVVSHNDINKHNVLWNKKQIILIDFEWANLNLPEFDYVQLKIAHNISLIPETKKFHDIYLLSLIYFLLWTYEMSESKFIIKQRKKYLRLIYK